MEAEKAAAEAAAKAAEEAKKALAEAQERARLAAIAEAARMAKLQAELEKGKRIAGMREEKTALYIANKRVYDLITTDISNVSANIDIKNNEINNLENQYNITYGNYNKIASSIDKIKTGGDLQTNAQTASENVRIANDEFNDISTERDRKNDEYQEQKILYEANKKKSFPTNNIYIDKFLNYWDNHNRVHNFRNTGYGTGFTLTTDMHIRLNNGKYLMERKEYVIIREALWINNTKYTQFNSRTQFLQTSNKNEAVVFTYHNENFWRYNCFALSYKDTYGGTRYFTIDRNYKWKRHVSGSNRYKESYRFYHRSLLKLTKATRSDFRAFKTVLD